MYSETLKLCGDKAQLMKGFEEHKSYTDHKTSGIYSCLSSCPLVKRDLLRACKQKMATDFVIVASITATTQVRFVSFSETCWGENARERQEQNIKASILSIWKQMLQVFVHSGLSKYTYCKTHHWELKLRALRTPVLSFVDIFRFPSSAFRSSTCEKV